MRHPIIRYGIALCVVGLAAALRGLLGAHFPGVVPFATFFPAVLVVALLAGPGPGTLATGLSAFLGWFFWLRSTAELAPPNAAATLNLVLFVIACSALVITAEAVRRYHGRSIASERRFRAADDVALDGFATMQAVRGPDGDISDFQFTYANAALARILHRSREGLVDYRLLEVFPGHRTHPALFPSYVQVVATGEAKQAEVLYDADGVRAWLRLNAVKVNDGIALSLRDVTERKQREDALRESEERFRLLADATDDVFWIIDLPAREVVYLSPACDRVWGFSHDALERDPTAWRENLHPEDREEVEAVFDDMLEGRRQTFELIYRMRAAAGAWRWVRDKAWHVRAGEIERVVGVMIDITAEKEAEEQQRLLAQDLDHRFKNTFALIQSIVRLSARGTRDVDVLASSLEGRIHALARSQEVVVKGSRGVTLLESIVREALAPYAGRDGQIRIEGPAIEVGPRAVPMLHMSFHELATNATKYGALSVPSGSVSVTWDRVSDGQGEAVELRWTESGGPDVHQPARRGFGSTLVEHVLAGEFGGSIEIAFPSDGVTCTMRLPLSDRLTLGRDAA